jgi:hypothetical protein
MLEGFDESKEDPLGPKKREIGDTLSFEEDEVEADANDGVPDPPPSIQKPAKKKKTREVVEPDSPPPVAKAAPAPAKKAKKTQVAKVKAAATKTRPPPRYPLRNRLNNL